MRKRRCLALLAPALLGMAAAAAAAATNDRPIRLAIAPGRIGEVCMPLAQGQTLRWRFKASTTVDFNLHHHVDAEVRMPIERKAVRSDSGEHLIDQHNDWCLMWTAPAGSKRVTIDGAWSEAAAK